MQDRSNSVNTIDGNRAITLPDPPHWLVFNDPHTPGTRIGVQPANWAVEIDKNAVVTFVTVIYGSGGFLYRVEGPMKAFDAMEEAIDALAGPRNAPVAIERHSEGEIILRASR
jgi:hypothetical protein